MLALSGRNLTLVLWIVTVVFAVGCQTPAAPFDPFLAGRSTIPPPGTAVPAPASPYYNGAPPTVTVPAPGATYTSPGAVPAAAPVISTPPAGAGQLPRGISVPQSSKPAPSDGSQLVIWQKSGESSTAKTEAGTKNGAKSGDAAGRAYGVELASAKNGATGASQSTGVTRAIHEAQSSEPPIRIVEPAAKTTAATTEATSPVNSASDIEAPVSRGKTLHFRKLPELTDYPPAAGGDERAPQQ
jgi:hypothetical protein